MPTPASWMAGVISDWDSPDDKDGEFFYKRKGVLPISLIPDSSSVSEELSLCRPFSLPAMVALCDLVQYLY